MLNQTAIMGRLTADPELRRTGNGTAVCSFTLAVERDMKPGEDGKRETDYIDCVVWKGTAEFLCKYFKKGRMVLAAGRLQTRKWKDKQGQTRKATELHVSALYFGDEKKLEKVAGAYPGETNEDEAAYGEIEGNGGNLPI